MSVVLTGGGFVTASGWGKIKDKLHLPKKSARVTIPGPDKIFPKVPQRWGRFDNFTRMGCAAAALALQDAGYAGSNDAICGMLVASFYDTVNTDREYYRTTIEQEGALSSPNLFSYTLPVIVLGECCVAFKLRGPTFCVGDNQGAKGLSAITSAVRLIEAGKADQMLAGLVEDPPADVDDRPASIFVFLQKNGTAGGRQESVLDIDNGCLKNGNGQNLQSILELFKLE